MADTDNLRIQLEINKAISERQKMLEATTKSLKEQTAIAAGLAKAISGANVQDDVLKKIQEMKKALEEGSKKAKELGNNLGDGNKDYIEGIEESTDKAGLFNKKLQQIIKNVKTKNVVALAMFDGLAKGFKFSINLVTSLIGLLGSVASGMWNIGKSILAIPFKIFGKLIDIAQGMTGFPELMQAFENIRKEFGSFKEDISKNVISSAKNMRGELSNTGLSVWRVFGMAHERLEFFKDLALGMGATFNILGQQIADSSEEVGAFQKALGISHEQMRGFGEIAIRSGKQFTEVFREVSNYTLQLGDTFGVSQKVIGKDIAKMVNDVQHFSSVTIKQMAESSVYARKLGIEVEKLFGVFEKFDNFEDAAVGAARLSQVFGANVDAMKLMNSQSPADRVEMLRQSMRAAGKDAQYMSRQELNLLASQSGLDAQTAKLAFSFKNQGKSLQDIQKESGKAEKKQLTQAEAMSKLADSIERLVRTGPMAKGGFFAYFFRGFERGIKGLMGMNFEMTSFYKIMFNIRRSLMETFWAGVQVGQIFRKMFPGVEKAFQGIADFFDPKRFRKLFYAKGGIIDVFRNFFSDIAGATKPEDAVRNVFKGFKTAFTQFFFGTGEAGKLAAGGLADFGKALLKIFTGLIPVVAKGAAIILNALAGFIKDPSSIGVKLDASAAGRGVKNLLSPLWEALKNAKNTLGPPIKLFLTAIKDRIIEFAQSETGKKIIKGAFTVLFGPAVLGAIFQGLVSGVGTIFAKKLIPALLNGGQLTAEGVGSKMPGILGKIFGKAGIIGIIIAASVGVNEGFKKFKDNTIKSLEDEFGPQFSYEAESKIGSGLAGILDTITFGLLPDDAAQKISNTIARLSHFVFDAVKNLFGDAFSREFKQLFIDRLNVFSALGDVIKSIFTGDTTKIADALANFGELLLKMLVNTFKFVFLELLPKALPFVFEYAAKFVSGLLDVLQKLLRKLEDIPILGWLVTPVRITIEYLGKFFGKVGDFFNSIRNVMKKIDFTGPLTEKLDKAWETIKSALKKGEKAIGGFVKTVLRFFLEPIIKGFETFAEKLLPADNPISKALGQLKKDLGIEAAADLGDAMKNVGDNLIKGLKDGTEGANGIGSNIGNQVVKGVEEATGIHSASKVMKKIGQHLTDGMKLGVSGMSGAVSDKVYAGVSNIRDTIIALNEQVSQSTSDMSKRQVVNIKSVLDAYRSGLGANGRYTVEHKNNPINVNFQINMDADNLENVLVSRPGSKIATFGGKG